ncbi:hypothetical protein BG004_003777 [Podila humilis]|nr:hypothetical protein BG004_003777 [Podila humilis]
MSESSLYGTQAPRFTEEEAANYKAPGLHVLIVGAGLAGLYLAIHLERANINYEIFERATTIQPLGAILSLNANIMSSFEQIGLFDELTKISLPITDAYMYNENLKKTVTIPGKTIKEDLGYDYLAFPRPELYALLLSKIPKEKIHLNKKVLSILQNKEGRRAESMYKQLAAEGKLSAHDAEQMNVNFSTLVGTTDALDAEKFPPSATANFSFMIGDKGNPYTWSTFSVPGNKVCWGVQVQLSPKAAEDESFRNSEWGPESNESMIKDVYEFKTPVGKLGEMIDHTPKERISRVFLEDKLFETWHHRRTVLIGDACHKLLPSAGQGAVCAFQDAVILANCLYDMASAKIEDVEAALQEFRLQRYDYDKKQYERSKTNAKLIYGQEWHERLLRRVVFGILPASMLRKPSIEVGFYRPQASFLPLAPPRGPAPHYKQPLSKKYIARQESEQHAK